MNITYDIDSTKPFKAVINYAERPEEAYSDQGLKESFEIVGDSWDDLIDKVSQHFKDKQ